MNPTDQRALSASDHRVEQLAKADEGLRPLARALVDLAIQVRAEQRLRQRLGEEDKIV